MLAHRVRLEFKKCAFRRNASWKKSCGTRQQHEKKVMSAKLDQKLETFALMYLR